MHSVVQNINRHRYPDKDWQQKMKDAEVHVRFCLTLYELQRRAGRYYLHEHPRTAASWRLRSVQRFSRYVDTIFVDSNMCRFGMETEVAGERGLVEKATTFMTNSMEVAVRLDRQCSAEHKRLHKHLPLIGCRMTRPAQIYPAELCQAVAEGIRSQKMVDQPNLCGMDLMDLGIGDNEFGAVDYCHDPEDAAIWEAWDDVTGKALKPDLVREARADEIGYVDKMRVYDVVSVGDCWRMTGRAPIRSRWVDISKGDDLKPRYRSRWVAQEIRLDKGQWELFPGTPPLEAVRFLLAMCASNKGFRIMSNDVSRAYFFAEVKGDIFMELPHEAKDGGDRSKCAKLRKASYGTRAAASCWAECYSDVLLRHGFTRGR